VPTGIIDPRDVLSARFVAFYFRCLKMSEYVEARYAIVVLRQAHLARDRTARDLVVKLLRDLRPRAGASISPSGGKRGIALDAIATLAFGFNHSLQPPDSCWKAAYEAALDWCNQAKE
jgi:hypothetical protein